MTANTVPLSNAEKEVRKILDEAISACVTASTPGISWGKLMTIIQMQKPLVDDYISQRRRVQPIQEVNIGDSVNPFRAEIVKLIHALQLTGRFTNTNTAPLEITRENNRVIDPYKVSLYDNDHQTGREITVSKKSKNTKWGVKHFGMASKMHEVSEESHLLNTYNDAGGGQNSGPFSFTFNVHSEGITKGHQSEQLNELNIDTATYRNDYNSYLIARYESEYGDVNLLSTKNGEFSKLHHDDEEEEAQYVEHDMHVLKKSSSDHLCVYSKNKSENRGTSSSLCDNTNQKLQTCKSKGNGIHCDEQTSSQIVKNVSQHYHPETSGKWEEKPLGANLYPTYSVICADSSSEHLAWMSHKNERDYTYNKMQERSVSDEQKEPLSEVTDSESVCELYRMKEKSYNNNSVDSASKGNSPNNKILVTNDQLHLHPVAGSRSQFINLEHVMDERTYVTRGSSKKYSSLSGNTAEYHFQNFIQPEDENNIQMLLEHNLSSGCKSTHYKSIHEVNAVPDCILEDTLGDQSRQQIQENIVDKNEETETSILEHRYQIMSSSSDSLNDKKETVSGRKPVLQTFHQVNDIQQHLNNATSCNNTAVSNSISTSYVNTAADEYQNKNSSNTFSNKKVYWSSVGLIIEDLIDSNILPVAGQSDMTLTEPQDSKADKKSFILYDDKSTRDQIIDIGNTNSSTSDISDGTEDTSFITEPDVKGSTDLLGKGRSPSGKLLSEGTSDKSKKTKNSQPKRSFFKSLQRVFHFSRKH
ncbi:uncharacterized protein LOC126188979 [Schistocerca cancellata]|uniref:uncharacterized protein LOC126188979 n=1 Tax=Schistocerca cancellata TaxID=274614 RepID=UPI0021178EFA|nr:uncharacterized protein LOC126188979 [Schistocerca cancellata]